VDVFIQWKFKFISQNFKLIDQRNWNSFVVQPVTRWKMLKVSSWRVSGRSVGWMIWRGVLCLAEIDQSSDKPEVCDKKRKLCGINTSVKITKTR
jgi:hypothetical protein